MDVELLVIAECPHAEPARRLLRAALDDIGLKAVSFNTTVVTTLEQAENVRFLGSPTVLTNGVDLFAEPNRPAAVACRIYSNPDVTSGLPSLAEVRKRLKQAADLPLRERD